MVGDPVGDFIIRLKNASMAGHDTCAVPYSRLKHAIADKLAAKGYIVSAEKKGRKVKKTLEISLARDAKGGARIHDVDRISKPGRRVYRSAREIRPVKYGHGTLVLSTPRGILTGEEAREGKVGGEALFNIW